MYEAIIFPIILLFIFLNHLLSAVFGDVLTKVKHGKVKLDFPLSIQVSFKSEILI